MMTMNHDDGSADSGLVHQYEARRATLQAYELDGDVTGEVRWSLTRGVTFRLKIQLVSLPKPKNVSLDVKTGSVREFNRSPECIVETPDGILILLFGLSSVKHVCRQTNDNGVTSAWTEYYGTAAYAQLTLPQDSVYAFFYETEPSERILLPTLCPSYWSSIEEYEFGIGSSITQQGRGVATIDDHIRLVSSQALGRCSDNSARPCIWCEFSGGIAAIKGIELSAECYLARSFLSFLAGTRLPFLWADRISEPNKLERLYFPCFHAIHSMNELHTHQPFPLGSTVEALQRGKEVVDRIPALWSRYKEISNWFDFDWILNPLWTSEVVLLDDRLALALVSIERLATAYKDFADRSNQGGTVNNNTFLTKAESKAVRIALKECLQKLNLDVQKEEILVKKIDQLPQMPNQNKIERLFRDLNINLSDQEINTIRYRNHAMHGRQTLHYENGSSNADAEMLRLDTLRMIIYKGLFALLEYDGPFYDYSARINANFPLKSMSDFQHNT